MIDPTLMALKKMGLTPASLVAGIAFAGAWWKTLAPIPDQMAQLNQTVQQMSTKVEIHSVLIGQLSDIKTDVTVMRKELSTIEGRLATLKNYPPQ
jgi:hypothetical protein